ncbi:hypothetical protein AJ80_05578 [Polytolypa hystricis UAMH7299]|uniref:Uncharacterized protein n=1 Tax=Polytolypa hystricis (strain UAMH7299) TaxID=1447883 RepID=A0A2B7XUF4_POLH7|nr:hypothetical protein AJ80_05578 [Polytolypa hystricis UAMH7299]
MPSSTTSSTGAAAATAPKSSASSTYSSSTMSSISHLKSIFRREKDDSPSSASATKPETNEAKAIKQEARAVYFALR